MLTLLITTILKVGKAGRNMSGLIYTPAYAPCGVSFLPGRTTVQETGLRTLKRDMDR